MTVVSKCHISCIGNLRFWVKYLSWSICDNCGSIATQKLLPSYSQRTKCKKNVVCNCTSVHYFVPEPNNIPEVLNMLQDEDVYILRPFDIDLGPFQHKRYGYRVRSCLFSLKCSKLSVQEKISSIEDPERKEHCQRAYEYLMASPDSAYRDYVLKREHLVARHQQPQKLEIFSWEGIECALWPTLYPYLSWCESTIVGDVSRVSSKVSFLTKCFGPLLDYSLNFELLQFISDRWLLKTITGAISQGRHSQCSPYRSLASKAFSPAYWENQHRYLVDVVRQKGYPSLFITISPSEWTFTTPKWLDNLRDQYGFRPTQTALFETFHFIHVLEQIVCGYICGTNTLRWKNHLLNYNRIKGKNSVDTYFYRFEFQG